jgi:molybdopterin synthase sulfur carrier subunit
MDAAERAGEPVDPGAVVTVRYWAGARAAAGVDVETVAAPGSVAELVARLGGERPSLRPVLEVASVLVDGRAGSGEDPVPVGALVEVLPPFAGG